MRNKASTGMFMRVYNAARRARLLEFAWFQRIFLFAYFLYKRWYEDPFWRLTQSHGDLFANGDVLDIGANIGYTACVFAGAIRPPGKVYAFEPDRASLATLRDVMHREQLDASVEIVAAAVGSTDGTVEFWHNDEHSADHRVVTPAFKSSTLDQSNVSTVPVTSVDSFVASHSVQDICFIKIDVQGYELAVCEGMRRTLEKFPRACVAFEYAPDGMRELGFDPAALLRFFRSAGYRLYILTRSGLQPALGDDAIDRAAQRSGYVDLLCSQQELA